MGASKYNRLLNLDLGYTKYSSTTRADFWNKITLIVRYSRPILTTVRKSLKGILRTKGRDQGVIKRSLAVTATTSYTTASSVRASSASLTLFVN